ncbi:MAG: hypothetical protein JOZ62_21875 [Acidobacteriaceae bacterium]|nr:hypothetical protein [Acidobacteriaceae bacterium]
MFERYTEKARRAIFFARYEASQFGSPYIEPEHLLLGIFREGANVRRLVGPDTRDSIRREIAAANPPREKVSTSVDLPLSNASKRVLAYGAEEAERLNHPHIDAEHLLAGILRASDRVAATLLAKHGITLEPVREMAVQETEVMKTREKSSEALFELRTIFEPSLRRLTPEIEPALIFSPQRLSEKPE